MPKKTPTARTLAELRKLGYTAEVVEKRLPIPGCFVTRDLFGCIDILAVRLGEILGVQATSGSNVSARIKKSLLAPGLKSWLESGGLFEVWGWRLSSKSRTWICSKRPLTLIDLTEEAI